MTTPARPIPYALLTTADPDAETRVWRWIGAHTLTADLADGQGKRFAAIVFGEVQTRDVSTAYLRRYGPSDAASTVIFSAANRAAERLACAEGYPVTAGRDPLACAACGQPTDQHLPLMPATARPGFCTSTFVSPDGDGTVHHCTGVPNHPGVMHGAAGYAWGDRAATSHHPGENLIIRMGQLREAARRLHAANTDAATRIIELLKLHRNQDGRCAECAHAACDASCEYACDIRTAPWPCTTATVLGAEQLPDGWYEELAAAEQRAAAANTDLRQQMAGGPVDVEPAPATTSPDQPNPGPAGQPTHQKEPAP